MYIKCREWVNNLYTNDVFSKGKCSSSVAGCVGVLALSTGQGAGWLESGLSGREAGHHFSLGPSGWRLFPAMLVSGLDSVGSFTLKGKMRFGAFFFSWSIAPGAAPKASL